MLPSPSLSHFLAKELLKRFGPFFKPRIPKWKSLSWQGLSFPNPLGVAGGLDKDGEMLKGLWALGAGFIEVGTVTPKPQVSNQGTILLRDINNQALWNKMGFPNQGVDALVKRLSQIKSPYPCPLFINIGKNRETPLAEAACDYILCMNKLSRFADLFVINISSPNTQGLRDLFNEEYLSKFLNSIMEERPLGTPILLKLSPDLENQDFTRVLDLSLDHMIDGWVISNTTTSREDKLHFPSSGGVSGLPLAKRSTELLSIANTHLGEKKGDRLLVSAGGVLKSQDVMTRLELGANLVQSYTGFVLNGPMFFRTVAKEIGG